MATALIGSTLASSLPFLLEKLFPGKKEKMQTLPTMTPEQQQLLSQLLGGLGGAQQSGLGFLQNLLSGDTSKFEQPLMTQFYQQTIPGLAERFTGMGAGAQNSSAFQQSLGSAGAGLAQQLGALRGGLQMQGLGQLSSLLGTGLSARPFENIFRPGQSGIGSAMAPGIGAGIGQSLTQGLGNADYSKLWDMIKGIGSRSTPGPYGTSTPGRYDMYNDITG